MEEKEYTVVDTAKLNLVVSKNMIIAGETVGIIVEQQDEQFYEKIDLDKQSESFRYESIDLESNHMQNHSQKYQQSVEANFTVVGNKKIRVFYNDQPVNCKGSCVVSVKPGDIWLPNTNVYDEKDVMVKSVLKNEGDENIRLSYEFFDRFGNPVDELNVKQNDIKVTLGGNMMSELTFSQEVENKQLDTHFGKKESEVFQYLVAAANYTIEITYQKQQKDLRLDILGDNDDKDNLPISTENSHCFPRNIKLVKCKDTSVIYCDIKSEGNKTYSRPVDKNLLNAKNNRIKDVGYHFNILNGNVFNRFAIVVNWTEQCKFKEQN